MKGLKEFITGKKEISDAEAQEISNKRKSTKPERQKWKEQKDTEYETQKVKMSRRIF